jgi:hypothetical protein
MVRIDTHPYEAVHGHKPRQPRGQSQCTWAFAIDQARAPVVFRGSYTEALRRAKARARWCVAVLPQGAEHG